MLALLQAGNGMIGMEWNGKRKSQGIDVSACEWMEGGVKGTALFMTRRIVIKG